jgi:hypothetical protein
LTGFAEYSVLAHYDTRRPDKTFIRKWDCSDCPIGNFLPYRRFRQNANARVDFNRPFNRLDVIKFRYRLYYNIITLEYTIYPPARRNTLFKRDKGLELDVVNVYFGFFR